MPKTRDDLLKEIEDEKKIILFCRLIQWLFWISAVAVAIAVAGGFWKWAVVVGCAVIGLFAWMFHGAGQDEIEETRTQLANLNTSAAPAGGLRFQFTRDLKLGMTGQDVNQLQRYLISHASGPVVEQLARHGTTETFGALTQNALKEFQKKAGINPVDGSFGPITRAYVNGHD